MYVCTYAHMQTSPNYVPYVCRINLIKGKTCCTTIVSRQERCRVFCPCILPSTSQPQEWFPSNSFSSMFYYHLTSFNRERNRAFSRNNHGSGRREVLASGQRHDNIPMEVLLVFPAATFPLIFLTTPIGWQTTKIGYGMFGWVHDSPTNFLGPLGCWLQT